jgi:hypothetical protein
MPTGAEARSATSADGRPTDEMPGPSRLTGHDGQRRYRLGPIRVAEPPSN